MADTLTQAQIDAVLAGVVSGAAKAADLKVSDENVSKEHKKYDFRSPKKFTKERLKTLDGIFDSYSRLLSSYLTVLLRLYCKVSLKSIEEQRFFEFNNALPDYVMMGIAELQLNHEDLEDLTTVVQFSNSLTFIMIDRLLGGKGSSKFAEREFTELEASMMSHIVNKMVGLMKDPWATYVDVNPVLEGIETNARVMSAITYDETVIICTLEAVIGETPTLINICMPVVQLDDVMHKYASKTLRSARRFDEHKDRERRESILGSVANTSVNVTAVLGEVTLDMLDVVNLQTNDIIPLGKNINSNVVIKVGGTKWFDGKIGVMNSNKAVLIEHVLTPEQQKN